MNIGKFKLSRKWTIFSVTANGTFMSTLSAGIVNIALPTMSAQFQVDLDHIQLVVSMYLLVLTCLLPVFGKLSDLYSRKWMYLGGFIVFGVGALIGALSKSLGMMLLARAVQGIGSSAMMATSQALIAQIFHGKSRGKAFGAIGAVVACGSLAGPAIGGALIQLWGWPSVFWVSVPICIIGVWRGIYIIPRFKAVKKSKNGLVRRLMLQPDKFCLFVCLKHRVRQRLGFCQNSDLFCFIRCLFHLVPAAGEDIAQSVYRTGYF